MIFRVKRRPFSPLGEKVADRPDEVEIVTGSVRKMPPHPNPLPQFFGRMLPCDAMQNPQKTGGEGGHGAGQLGRLRPILRLTRGRQARFSLPELGREQIAPHD